MSQNRQTQGRKAASGSTAKKKKTTKAAQAQRRTTARHIRAGAYMFMALVGALSLFNISGFFIDWYRLGLGTLIGFGYYLAAPAFLTASIIVLTRIKGKVRLKEWAVFSIPVLFGAIGHIVRDMTSYSLGMEGLKLLAKTGRELTSGGLISGLLGMALKAAISAVGGIIVCFLAMAACVFVIFEVTPAAFFKKLKPAPEEDEPEEIVEERARRKAEKEEARARRRREKEAETAERAEAERAEAERRRQLEAEKQRQNTARREPPVLTHGKTPVFVDFFKDEDKGPSETTTEAAPTPSKDPTEAVKPTFTVEEAETPRGGKEVPFDFIELEKEDKPPYTTIETVVNQGEAHVSPSPETDRSERVEEIAEAISQKLAPKDAAEGTPDNTSPANFDIYTADNPPPAELSLDEKRQAEAEAHERAAEENDVSGIIRDAAIRGETGQYIYPPLSLLTPGDPGMGADHESIVRCAERLVDTLGSFNIESTIVNVTKGPTVTRYELQLKRGIKFAKVTSLADDIALALGAASVRIAPIPANNSVGIEVPNDIQEIVTLRDILGDSSFANSKAKLSFAVGKDIAGQCVVGDISKMPHMLIAGTTGSGKSVCINSIIISLIYKSSPEEVKLIMVDPKMIELGMYNGIPHLLIPVVTDPKKAAGALNWAVGEMMRRYKVMSEAGARNLEAYNEIMKQNGKEPLPQIVIIIDELADLMFVAAREVEESIARIAQMARAAGMHLIIATQRPSADVITGLMKANIPSRVAFAVASQIESRIILDQNGAEKLIGRGDMLYNPLGAGKPMRVQGTFISTKEVEDVIEFVKENGSPDYSQEILDHIERQAEADSASGGKGGVSGDEEDDPLLMDAISVVVDRGEASTSLLQRRLKLGYARAARLIDIMEERGIVGPFEGSKPRTVTLTPDQWNEMQLRMRD